MSGCVWDVGVCDGEDLEARGAVEGVGRAEGVFWVFPAAEEGAVLAKPVSSVDDLQLRRVLASPLLGVSEAVLPSAVGGHGGQGAVSQAGDVWGVPVSEVR